MSMTVSQAVKKCIRDVIMYGEKLSEYKTLDTVSVLELLEAEKRRRIRAREFLRPVIESLKETIPYIKDIECLYCNKDIECLYCNKDSKTMDFVIILNKEVNDVNIDQIDPKLWIGWSVLYGTGIGISFGIEESLKEKILSENEELFGKIANYEFANNYIVRPQLNTISNDFQVNLRDDGCMIEFENGILDAAGKYFQLFYPYLKSYKCKNPIYVGDDLYNLGTDIWGLQSIFTKPVESNSPSEEVNPILRFMTNLKVYKTDVSEFLLKEIENK